MREIILVKNGEIALKGLNRNTFEAVLIKNMRRRLKKFGSFEITKAQSTIYVEPKEETIPLDSAVQCLQKVFGIAALSRALVVEKDYEAIRRQTLEYLADVFPQIKTFKVEAKRADKTFPMKTPEICRELGGAILSAYPHLKVDVNAPEWVVNVEIRETAAYIHGKQLNGAGGMPIGTSGKALLLISGGIDSPVAGYMMAKRGVEISAIHFVSPPYTSDRALQKVEMLCEKMCEYCGRIPFSCVEFTEIQEAIRTHCPEELFTVIMRRMMMKIALEVAKRENMSALITGESLAQVASQTISAIACTDAVSDIPVFRPLIGMDKNEIVEISRKIDTFETSILPYEDCCTVFTPKHPKTRPNLQQILEAEQSFDFAPLICEAVEGIQRKTIHRAE